MRCASSARNAPAQSLLYAEFSPDGARVAYLSNNNLYVEASDRAEVKAAHQRRVGPYPQWPQRRGL